MKHYIYYALLGLCAVTVTACSDDDDAPKYNPDVPTVAEGAFVLNQGSYYSQIEGSLSLIDYATSTSAQNLFQAANGRSIGSTPQGAVVYGSKIYIGVYESNTIEIIDRNTYKSVKQISLKDAEGQSPRALIADGGKVYISMYNGYVSRLDTLSLSIDNTVKVGPNPEIMAIKDGYLYVPNSDGLNWEVGYGTTASKINLKTFAVDKTFEVGLNPTKFATNGSELFVLCMGNYYDVAAKVYQVSDDGKLSEVAEATLIDVHGDKLYYINAPYGAQENDYAVYDIKTKAKTAMVSDKGVDSPAGLGVDPINGNIVITSYNLSYGYADYMSDGYAKVYDAQGKLLNTYTVGVGPVCIFFNYK